MILRRSLRKWRKEVWTGFIWLRSGSSSRLYWI